MVSCFLGFSSAEIVINFTGLLYVSIKEIYVFLGISISSFFSIFSFIWVLNKKSRSYFHLIFFLLLPAAPIITFIQHGSHYFWTWYPDEISFLGIFLWVIGTVVILILESNSRLGKLEKRFEKLKCKGVEIIQEQLQNSETTKSPNILWRLSRNRIRRGVIFSSMAIVMVAGTVSGNGYFDNNYYYKEYSYVYRNPFAGSQEPAKFRLEYPSYYFLRVEYSRTDGFVKFERRIRQWFFIRDHSSISIRLFRPERFSYSSNATAGEKGIKYQVEPPFVSIPYEVRQVIQEKQITVDNISAEYLVLKFDKSTDTYYKSKITETAYFEHSGYLWVISMDYYGKNLPDHDAQFAHILNSFHVLE